MSYAMVNLISNIIGIYTVIIFVWVAMSWLQSFGIINTRNAHVRNILSVLHAFVEPVLAPIRRVIPSIGGLDLSPIVLLLGLSFARDILFRYAT